MVRVSIVDSGINDGHPHVGAVTGGVFIRQGGDDRDYLDRIGHGTAVAGAIREKAPNAELYAVRIFEHRLTANIDLLMRGLEWCLDHDMHIVNLSVGTANDNYRVALEDYVECARSKGVYIVSAAGMLPGSLDGVIGVECDPECPRETCRYREGVLFASPYPRSIPGVPVERNLSGVSFAIANCTGLLAALLESAPLGMTYQEWPRQLVSSLSSPAQR